MRIAVFLLALCSLLPSAMASSQGCGGALSKAQLLVKLAEKALSENQISLEDIERMTSGPELTDPTGSYGRTHENGPYKDGFNLLLGSLPARSVQEAREALIGLAHTARNKKGQVDQSRTETADFVALQEVQFVPGHSEQFWKFVLYKNPEGGMELIRYNGKEGRLQRFHLGEPDPFFDEIIEQSNQTKLVGFHNIQLLKDGRPVVVQSLVRPDLRTEVGDIWFYDILSGRKVAGQPIYKATNIEIVENYDGAIYLAVTEQERVRSAVEVFAVEPQALTVKRQIQYESVHLVTKVVPISGDRRDFLLAVTRDNGTLRIYDPLNSEMTLFALDGGDGHGFSEYQVAFDNNNEFMLALTYLKNKAYVGKIYFERRMNDPLTIDGLGQKDPSNDAYVVPSPISPWFKKDGKWFVAFSRSSGQTGEVAIYEPLNKQTQITSRSWRNLFKAKTSLEPVTVLKRSGWEPGKMKWTVADGRTLLSHVTHKRSDIFAPFDENPLVSSFASPESPTTYYQQDLQFLEGVNRLVLAFYDTHSLHIFDALSGSRIGAPVPVNEYKPLFKDANGRYLLALRTMDGATQVMTLNKGKL